MKIDRGKLKNILSPFLIIKKKRQRNKPYKKLSTSDLSLSVFQMNDQHHYNSFLQILPYKFPFQQSLCYLSAWLNLFQTFSKGLFNFELDSFRENIQNT